MEQVDDHLLADDELTVGEELEQQRADQRVIGCPYLDARHRQQPRAQIRQRRRPARRRKRRGQQNVTALVSGQVEQMEERTFRRPLGALDDDGTRFDEGGDGLDRQGIRCAQQGAGARLPDMGEMRLAATRRPVQQHRRSGPVGPAIEQGDGRLVARRDEEIIGAKGGPMCELKDELRCHRALSRLPDRRSGWRGTFAGQSASARR